MEGLEGRAEARNLITIYAALSDRDPADVLAQFAGQGFGAFKPELADLAVATLGPIRERLTRLLDDRGEVGRILERGAERRVTWPRRCCSTCSGPWGCRSDDTWPRYLSQGDGALASRSLGLRLRSG